MAGHLGVEVAGLIQLAEEVPGIIPMTELAEPVEELAIVVAGVARAALEASPAMEMVLHS